MARIVYIGDEATAAGLRLAGVETVMPDPPDAAATMRRAAADGAEMILLSGTLAARIPVEELEAALARETPLLALVPDVLGRGTPADLSHDVRRALGIET